MLYDHINAEISTGSLTSKQSCIDYMTWTYFFRRLLKNPSYYGLERVNANDLNKFLSNLIDDCLKQLSDSKCITLKEDGQISSTLLGILILI
jgi:activating signal cointegrator complex subunit 3